MRQEVSSLIPGLAVLGLYPGDIRARVESFGARGDGATDDSAALAAALAYSGAYGVPVRLTPGKTYRCDTALSFSGTSLGVGFIGGSILDFSHCSTLTGYITVTGPAWSATQALTADCVFPSRTIAVSDASAFSAGDVIRVYSSGVRDALGGTQSEFARIDSIASNTITLEASICGNYLTTDSASIDLVDTGCNPVFDVKIKGDKTKNATGLVATRVAKGRFKLDIKDCYDRSFWASHAIDCVGEGMRFIGADREGLGYGLASTGNQWCHWGNIIAHNCRHAVTQGKSSVYQVERFITIGNVTGTGCRDAVVDSHSGACDLNFGHVMGSFKPGNAADDGVMIQGDRVRFQSITLDGYEREGVIWQFYGGDTSREHFVDIGSVVAKPGPTGIDTHSLVIQNASGARAQDIDLAKVGSFIATGTRGILLTADDASIKRFILSGGNVKATAYHGLVAVASANGYVGPCFISGTKIETTSADTGYYAIYGSGAAYTAGHSTVPGATIELHGCDTVGGASTHMRAIDSLIKIFGGSQTFSGSGVKYAKSGIGAISGSGFVSATAGVAVLGVSGAASSVTGTTSETILGTVTVPAGMMGPNGKLEIESLWEYTNSANNKNLRIRFGGISGALFLNSGNLTTTASMHDIRTIQNANSESAQVGGTVSIVTGGLGSTTAALATGAIDTTANVDLVFTGQLANTGETITLKSYSVKLAYP